jgi:hypothetical protein
MFPLALPQTILKKLKNFYMNYPSKPQTGKKRVDNFYILTTRMEYPYILLNLNGKYNGIMTVLT